LTVFERWKKIENQRSDHLLLELSRLSEERMVILAKQRGILEELERRPRIPSECGRAARRERF
jgi:hypothetical protein